jgi:hypothetical protein
MDSNTPGSSIFTVDPIFGQGKAPGKENTPSNQGVSYTRPDYLDQIQTQPQYLLSCDPRELEKAAEEIPQPQPKQPEIYRPAFQVTNKTE